MKDTRTKILDVAEDLIQRMGVNAMSYKHISEAVGIRKPSIHHHFPKKENLVEALLERCHTTYGGRYKAIVEEGLAVPATLRELAAVFEEGLASGKICLMGTIGADRGTLQEKSQLILEQTLQGTITIFSRAFAQGQKEGSLRLSDDPGTMAFIFFSFLIGTQVIARAHGGIPAFHSATEAMIASWEV